jgi:hypothetical protein
MKKIIVVLCLLTQSVIAGLIDLGEWDWSKDPTFPPSVHRLIYNRNISFFDEARVIPSDNGTHQWHGWVSLHGVLNGGTTFFTNLFQDDPTTTTQVSWDFGSSGYQMVFLDVLGIDTQGNTWVHYYRVQGDRAFTAFAADVTLEGVANIGSISFYGTEPGVPRPGDLPDGGTTLSLVVLGLLALVSVKLRMALQRSRGAFYRL